MMSSSDGGTKHGPLSLQMGAVTGAVDDLVHGYEQLVHTLPSLSGKIAHMHSNTENMANELGGRMSELVDGYQYLDGIASQIPETFLAAARNHRNALLASANMMTPADKENFEKQTQQLDNLRRELKSCAHERVVIDVLSRGPVNEARLRGHGNGSSRGNLRSRGHATSASGRSTNGAGTVSIGVRSKEGDEAQYKTPSSELSSTDPIIIPEYESREVQQQKAERNKKQAGDFVSRMPSKLVARNVGSGLMVPSMRHGSLPADIQNLKSSPSDDPRISQMYPDGFGRQRRSRPRSTLFGPFAKTLANKFGKTEAELAAMKDKIDKATLDFDKEKGKSYKKLKSIAEGLERNQAAKDDALINSVGELIAEAIGRFGDTLKKQNAGSRIILEVLQELASDKELMAASYVSPPVTIPESRQSQPEKTEFPEQQQAASLAKPAKVTVPTEAAVPEEQNVSGKISDPSLLNVPLLYQLVGNADTGIHWQAAPAFPTATGSTTDGSLGGSNLPDSDRRQPISQFDNYQGAVQAMATRKDFRVADGRTIGAHDRMPAKGMSGGTAADGIETALLRQETTPSSMNLLIINGPPSSMNSTGVPSGSGAQQSVQYMPECGATKVVFPRGQTDDPNGGASQPARVSAFQGTTASVPSSGDDPAADNGECDSAGVTVVQVPNLDGDGADQVLVISDNHIVPRTPLSMLTSIPLSNTYFDNGDALYDKLHKEGPYWLSRVALLRDKKSETKEEPHVPNSVPQVQPSVPSVTIVNQNNGLEKELVELMRGIVSTQENVMQGNHALMLAMLMRDREKEEGSIHKEEGEEETSEPVVVELPPLPQATSQTEQVVPPPSVPPKSRRQYNTSLGEVVLEEDLAHGVYRTKPEEINLYQGTAVAGVPGGAGGTLAGVGVMAGGKASGVSAVTSAALVKEAQLKQQQQQQQDGPRLRRTANAVTMQAINDKNATPPVPVVQRTDYTAAAGAPVRSFSSSSSSAAASSSPTFVAANNTHKTIDDVRGSSSSSNSSSAPMTFPPSSGSNVEEFMVKLLQQAFMGGNGGAGAATAVTPESVAEAVSKGVEKGVKDALGLLDAVANPSKFSKNNSAVISNPNYPLHMHHLEQQDTATHGARLLPVKDLAVNKKEFDQAVKKADFEMQLLRLSSGVIGTGGKRDVVAWEQDPRQTQRKTVAGESARMRVARATGNEITDDAMRTEILESAQRTKELLEKDEDGSSFENSFMSGFDEVGGMFLEGDPAFKAYTHKGGIFDSLDTQEKQTRIRDNIDGGFSDDRRESWESVGREEGQSIRNRGKKGRGARSDSLDSSAVSMSSDENNHSTDGNHSNNVNGTSEPDKETSKSPSSQRRLHGDDEPVVRLGNQWTDAVPLSSIEASNGGGEKSTRIPRLLHKNRTRKQVHDLFSKEEEEKWGLSGVHGLKTGLTEDNEAQVNENEREQQRRNAYKKREGRGSRANVSVKDQREIMDDEKWFDQTDDDYDNNNSNNRNSCARKENGGAERISEPFSCRGAVTAASGGSMSGKNISLLTVPSHSTQNARPDTYPDGSRGAHYVQQLQAKHGRQQQQRQQQHDNSYSTSISTSTRKGPAILAPVPLVSRTLNHQTTAEVAKRIASSAAPNAAHNRHSEQEPFKMLSIAARSAADDGGRTETKDNTEVTAATAPAAAARRVASNRTRLSYSSSSNPFNKAGAKVSDANPVGASVETTSTYSSEDSAQVGNRGVEKTAETVVMHSSRPTDRHFDDDFADEHVGVRSTAYRSDGVEPANNMHSAYLKRRPHGRQGDGDSSDASSSESSSSSFGDDGSPAHRVTAVRRQQREPKEGADAGASFREVELGTTGRYGANPPISLADKMMLDLLKKSKVVAGTHRARAHGLQAASARQQRQRMRDRGEEVSSSDGEDRGVSSRRSNFTNHAAAAVGRGEAVTTTTLSRSSLLPRRVGSEDSYEEEGGSSQDPLNITGSTDSSVEQYTKIPTKLLGIKRF